MLQKKEYLHILLVEDNILNQRLMAIQLKNFGHITDIANNGAEGVEFYKTKHYDLILMDLMMPVMDGFEATYVIREIEKNDNDRVRIPIIAYTANTFNNDYNYCISRGMDHLLEKPFDVIKFREILEELE